MSHNGNGRLGSFSPGPSIKIVFYRSFIWDHEYWKSFVTLSALSEASNLLSLSSELTIVLFPSPSLPIKMTAWSVGLSSNRFYWMSFGSIG